MAPQTIMPPNPLIKAKSGSGPVAMDPEVLDRAEQAVEQLSGEYLDWAQQDIDGLRQAVALARANQANAETAIANIYRRALDMKGQGGGFGYDLITKVGDLLTKFMDGRESISGRDFRIIEAHIDALEVVLRDRIKGGGGALGTEIVEGLCTLGTKA